MSSYYNLKFVCIEDFLMEDLGIDGEPEISFIKGDTYIAREEDNNTYTFIDAQGDQHYMDIEEHEGYSLSDYLVILE